MGKAWKQLLMVMEDSRSTRVIFICQMLGSWLLALDWGGWILA